MNDIERLRRETSLSDLASQEGIQLQKNGDEWEGCCPFHQENTPSFTIFTGKDGVQRFFCFGCNERGDVIDFVEKLKGMQKRDAIRYLGGGQSAPNVQPRQIKARDVYEVIELLRPKGSIRAGQTVRIYNPKRAEDPNRCWGSFAPTAVYPYYNTDGSPLGYVLRHIMRDGSKETPMVCWVRLPSGEECWSRIPFPRPRPLYRHDSLKDGQVIIVEGEKCADAIVAATGRQAVSWAGGTFGIQHTDWSKLAGRSIVIWPDADEPGHRVAGEIAAILHGMGCSIKMIDVADQPKGWDVADAVESGQDGSQIVEFMKARAKVWTPPRNDPPPEPKKVAPIKQDKPEPARGAVAPISKPSESVKPDDNWRQDFVTNEEGVPKATVTINWALLLRHHPAMNNALAFDAFRLQIVLLRRPAWEIGEGEWTPRTLRESDYQKAVMWLESLRMTPKVATIAPVIAAVAEMQQFDALREYLEGLVWDGVPRVDGFFRRYAGALGDSDYPEIVSRRFLISAVARGLKPGCKVDTMPILEGAQGLKKSTLLKTLFGAQFFSDELSEIGSKDAKMEMQGVWGIEIAEMHRMNAAETNAVKKFMSQSTDRFRPPYGRTVIEAARRLVLAGTINPDGNPYLRDSTGARRFWPITVTQIDIEGVERDRDQIWAEAVHRFRNGEPWWAQEGELEEVEAQQTERTEVDVWTDAVLKALDGRSSILLSDLIREVGIPAKDASQHHAARIGRIMKSMGWVSTRDRTGGADRMKYVKPEEDDVPW